MTWHHLFDWLPSRNVRRTRRTRPRRTPWRFALPRLEWLEDRIVPTTWTVDQGGAGNFTTIGAAVSSPMVMNGDTINVHPGTYTEQLVNATAISKSLTLTGAGQGTDPTVDTIIQCPPTLDPALGLPPQPSTDTRPLVEIDNAAMVTMSGFTVTGPGPAANVSVSFGILVVGNATLNLHDTTVTSIRSPLDSNGQLDTDQTGAGIGVGIQSRNGISGQVGLATINDVIITDYQKSAIRVAFAGSMATITNNTITGDAGRIGPSTSIAQNGITIVSDATAMISGNTISDNEFAGGPPASGPPSGPDLFNDNTATGIINFGGAGTTIEANNIHDNDIGIYNFVSTLSAPTLVTGNMILNNRFHGVVVAEGDTTASNNTISGSLNGLVVVSFDGEPVESVATVTGNTISNNQERGVWVVDQSSTAPSPIATVFQNTIDNNGAGVVVGGGPNPTEQTQNDQTVISQNSIFDNTPNPRVFPAPPPGVTSGLGIDLGDDGVTLNAPPGTSPGPNNFVNFPILTSAVIEGGNLDLQGFALPGSKIELFIAAPDPTGFGEGKTYLVTLTEGSAADLDTTVGTYGPGPINGLLQGTNTTNRFRFLIPLASLPGVGAGAVLTSTATLDTPDDPFTSEFSGNITVTQSPSPPPSLEADVSLTKQANQSTPIFGTPVTYTLLAHNNGPGTATDVVATDVLPAGVVFVSATPSQGLFDPGSGQWIIGTLANGASATLQITGIVATIGPITNTAAVAALEFDPNLANNVSSVTIVGMFSAGQISKRLFLSSSDPPLNPATVAAEEAMFNALMPMWMNLWEAMLSEAESMLAARNDPGPGNGGMAVFEGNWLGSPLVVYANPFAGQVTAVQAGAFDFLYEDNAVAGVRLI